MLSKLSTPDLLIALERCIEEKLYRRVLHYEVIEEYEQWMRDSLHLLIDEPVSSNLLLKKLQYERESHSLFKALKILSENEADMELELQRRGIKVPRINHDHILHTYIIRDSIPDWPKEILEIFGLPSS